MQREIVKTIQDQQDWKPHRAKLCINKQEHSHVHIAQNVTMSHHHSCMMTQSPKALRQHAESDKRSKTSLNIQRLNDPLEHETRVAHSKASPLNCIAILKQMCQRLLKPMAQWAFEYSSFKTVCKSWLLSQLAAFFIDLRTEWSTG